MTEVATPPTPAPASDAPPMADYWGSDEIVKHFLPDGVQYFEIKVMNEGAKSQFQKLTNSDLVVGRDNTATVKMDPAKERHALIKSSVIGWKLFKGGEPVAYSKQLLDKWLDVAPPKVVEDLEFAIRMANPWMQADMSIEEIDKELDRLQQMRQQALDRAAGEGVSANK